VGGLRNRQLATENQTIVGLKGTHSGLNRLQCRDNLQRRIRLL